MIAYLQQVTRAELRTSCGRDVSRESSHMGVTGLIVPRPRSLQPGAPYTYVKTPEFLILWARWSARAAPPRQAAEHQPAVES
jgi:segregation and condensation protein B